MDYDPRKKDHGLPHDPFKALVAPRPIGWVSSLNADGVPNLAPYSFFNAVSDNPHIVMFASFTRKDSQSNAEVSGEFVCHMATYDLRDAMNMSSAPAPYGVSEFELAGLEMAPSKVVKPPRVAAAPIAMECVYLQTVPLADAAGTPARYSVILGEVVHIHINDAIIKDGFVDLRAARPIARCGYREYADVTSLFEMTRPDYTA